MEIPKVPNVTPSKFLTQRKQFNFLITFMSNEEVVDTINSLSDKATGPSSIPLKLLLLISDLIVIPLCHITNMSLSTGNYPDKLKLVQVTPIQVALHKISIISVLYLYLCLIKL